MRSKVIVATLFVAILLFTVESFASTENCNSCQDCQNELDSGNSIQLTQNITGYNSGGNVCLEVTSSSTTINCETPGSRRYKITGNGTTGKTGILVDGDNGAQLTGVTVKHCEVKNYYNGIRAEYASSSTIYNNVVRDGRNGIVLMGTEDVNDTVIDLNLVYDTHWAGIAIWGDGAYSGVGGPRWNDITNNFLDGNRHGVSTCLRSTRNTVYNNEIEESDVIGVCLCTGGAYNNFEINKVKRDNYNPSLYYDFFLSDGSHPTYGYGKAGVDNDGISNRCDNVYLWRDSDKDRTGYGCRYRW